MSEYIATEFDLASTEFISEYDEIVRCRDCDYYDHWDASGPYREKHVCGHWDYLEINPNGFCAWGERKDENGR